MIVRRIEIIVSPNGKTNVETKGFVGTACITASRFLERALGRRTAESKTAEFYQGNAAEHTHESENTQGG